MLKCKSSLAAGLSIAAALFAATAHPVPGQAAPTGTELHAVDLTNVAQTLVANGPQAKAYIGRRFEAEGKYRGGGPFKDRTRLKSNLPISRSWAGYAARTKCMSFVSILATIPLLARCLS